MPLLNNTRQSCTVYLGIDPALSNTGVSIISAAGDKYRLLHSYTITSPITPSLDTRLHYIYSKLSSILLKHRAQVNGYGVETCYVHRNYNIALKLGMIQGLVSLALTNNNIKKIEHVAPAQIRKIIFQQPHATKNEVKDFVLQKVKGTNKSFNNHIIDAIAVAMCVAQLSS